MEAGQDGEDPDDLGLDPEADLLRVLGRSSGFRHFGFRGRLRLSTPCCRLSTPYSLGLHDIHRGLL